MAAEPGPVDPADGLSHDKRAWVVPWPSKIPGFTPGVAGDSGIERVAKRELNLAFGARERQPLGIVRGDEQRDDRDLHRFAVGSVLLEPRAGREHFHVLQTRLSW